MTIPAQLSLHGFIAKNPEFGLTSNGDGRFYARVGVEHFRKETDGAFTKLDPTFHNLVVYNKTAERAYARFKAGDQFVASGYLNEYAVDRTPSRQPDPPTADLSAAKEPSQAVGL